MLTCPMCKKSVAPEGGQCPRCQADLALLCDFRGLVSDGVQRADTLTKSGALAEAVWAYLEVLEVDPDNPAAREQVARVATAVRHFDRRRRGKPLRGAALFIAGALLVAAVGAAVYYAGYRAGELHAARAAKE